MTSFLKFEQQKYIKFLNIHKRQGKVYAAHLNLF